MGVGITYQARRGLRHEKLACKGLGAFDISNVGRKSELRDAVHVSISGRQTMFFLAPEASPIANIVYTELDFRTRPSSEGTKARFFRHFFRIFPDQ